MKAWNRYAGHRRPLPIAFIIYIVVACIRHSRIDQYSINHERWIGFNTGFTGRQSAIPKKMT